MKPPSWQVKLLKKVLFFIPASNPHSEPMYPKVRKWLIELDDAGVPIREVALDEAGVALFRAPEGDDYGFWPDSAVTFGEKDLDPITSEDFATAWDAAEKPNQVPVPMAHRERSAK